MRGPLVCVRMNTKHPRSCVIHNVSLLSEIASTILCQA
jgi:hypothetical protein